jgi:hypothetical protein
VDGKYVDGKSTQVSLVLEDQALTILENKFAASKLSLVDRAAASILG